MFLQYFHSIRVFCKLFQLNCCVIHYNLTELHIRPRCTACVNGMLRYYSKQDKLTLNKKQIRRICIRMRLKNFFRNVTQPFFILVIYFHLQLNSHSNHQTIIFIFGFLRKMSCLRY